MKDLLVHSNPVQCTVTVSVHCNNKDFQDLIYFYICYISKQRLLSSFRDSFVLISNLIRLFDHFIQLWDISSHLSSAVLHLALSKQSQSPCFFPSFFSIRLCFLTLTKTQDFTTREFPYESGQSLSCATEGLTLLFLTQTWSLTLSTRLPTGRMKTALCFCLQSSSDLFRRLL